LGLEPKNAKQQAGLEVTGQHGYILGNVQVQQQGNNLVVTGLRDAPPPAHSNLQGSNDDQDIDFGYESTEEIAAQIERESSYRAITTNPTTD
jgi:hypothetical protein